MEKICSLSPLLCYTCTSLIFKKINFAGIVKYRPVGKSFLADLFSESGNNYMLLWRNTYCFRKNVKASLCKLHNPAYNLDLAILYKNTRTIVLHRSILQVELAKKGLFSFFISKKLITLLYR